MKKNQQVGHNIILGKRGKELNIVFIRTLLVMETYILNRMKISKLN